MNENALISAEAAVTSKRSDHGSIFEADFDTLTVNPKQFYADPTFVKEAVQRFKAAGFMVATVDKFGISILAPKALYEQTFNISLVAQETTGSGTPNKTPVFIIANSERASLIDPQQSEFKDLLDGVALSRPAQNLGVETPPAKAKPWYLYPHEIPGKLNARDPLPSVENVMVAVIDSGWYFHHPYFVQKFYDLSTKLPYQIAVSDRLTDEYRLYQRLANAQVDGADDRRDFLNNLIEGFDLTGHGTSVISNLLPVAPKVAITVIKETAEESFSKSAFEIAINQKASIINCSFVVEVPFMTQQETLSALEYMRPAVVKMGEAINKGIMVVFGSGNYNPDHKDQIHLPGPGAFVSTVLVVGGAYYDQSNTLQAASYAYGFPRGYQHEKVRPIPHVCGLCAPKIPEEEEGLYDGLIYCPTPPTQENFEGDWRLLSGTSLAAPQIAGVCALIKKICPTATPEDIKEILIRTATPVVSGFTTQGFRLTEIEHQYGDETFFPGLVNIDKALSTAAFYNLNKFIDENATIKDAVADAARVQ